MINKPSDLGLFVEDDLWREHQWDAISTATNTPKRFVGMCAPTGSGKSISLISTAIASGKRTLILTSSKELQNQYIREFRYLNILDIRGRANYTCRATELGGQFYDGRQARSVDEGPCQFGEECALKTSGCTYYDKINQAKYKRLVSANYATWISANLYTEGWGKFDLICCDEAHEAEAWISRMLAVRFPRCYANLTVSKPPTTTNVALWASWATKELGPVRSAIRAEKKAITSGKRKRLTKLRTLQSLENSLDRMRQMTHDWRVFPDNSSILFQPIWVHEYAESLLFNHANKVVFASSTIVPNTLNLLGIPDNSMEFNSYPSTFPVSRRPIYYYPVVKMSHGMTDDAQRKWIGVVDAFISQRLDRKGLIHTVSYARQELLLKHSRYADLMIPSVKGSASSTVLQKFMHSSAPSILIGPNWSTGINLPFKASEYTIIPKVPFADITDPSYAARSEDNPDYGWYDAGITLTQSIGRCMRDAADQNETLITDKLFGAYLTTYRQLLPEWIHAAITCVKSLPPALEVL